MIFYIGISLLLLACNNRNMSEYEARIRATKIDIPLDSMKLLTPDLNIPISGCNDSAQFRYVVYFDSLQCSPCQLKNMGIWRSVIKHTEEIGASVDFQFIFCPKASQREGLEETYFNRKTFLRIFIDTTGVVERHNPLLSESTIFHAFVVNDSNHIEVIGNAGNSELVERRYYEFLRKKMAEKECSINH